MIRTSPQRQHPLNLSQRVPHRSRTRIRSKIQGSVLFIPPDHRNPREILLFVNPKAHIGLIILQLHVIPGPKLLNQAVFEQQRLFFIRRYQKINMCNTPHQKLHAISAVLIVDIRPDTVPQVLSLPNDPDTLRSINDFELASRLSYFLWSTMPDEELFTLARAGMLHDPEVIMDQVTRMIADPKAGKLVSNFAGQWLQLRNLALVNRDRELYPNFNGRLRRAMERESYMFFETILREDRSILNFLDADFTFVNQTLAKHYGIEGVEGDELRRVSLEGDERGGVLTQASVLTLTSYPTRTSPVVRGAWILENILGTVPPPPPENVPPLEVNPRKLEGTIREQFEKHRANEACASCHSRIDPLGFSLENYDAIGRWRTEERGHPV
ncbi:MAG TPA: DUF1592 domain-containing protein, partial [Candidatus Hydrogenedentes bacterium]|nr:DUF1592 domain-containing protein [Candidatus Hydrogenedentota bacterium]